MCVVLLETSDSGQARKSSRQLVTVQDPKISKRQRQFPQERGPVVKHQMANNEHVVYLMKNDPLNFSSGILSVTINNTSNFCCSEYRKMLYQCPGQFMGLRAKISFSTSKENMFSL